MMKSKTLTFALLLIVVLSFITIAISTKINLEENLHVEYDEDEFEGMEKTIETKYQNLANDQSSESSSTDDALKDEKPQPQPSRWRTQENWYMELAFITFIVCYAINFYMGKKTNEGIVTMWGKTLRSVFESNFSILGEKGAYVIMKVDPNTYTFTCSGRVHVHGLQVTLNLKKRQDLINVLMDMVGFGEPDKMTVEVAMKEDTSFESIVFGLTKQKGFKKMKTDNRDLELFSSKLTPPTALNDRYALMGDTEILSSFLLKNETVSILNNNENLVESMHFTDHSQINPKYPKTLSFVFRLPKVTEFAKLKPLTEMVINFIDYLATTPLPKLYKAKADKLREKNREEIHKQTLQERQEQAQKLKYEKEKKRKEEIGKLSPEEQRKAEEKEYKRQLKKRQQKTTRIVMG